MFLGGTDELKEFYERSTTFMFHFLFLSNVFKNTVFYLICIITDSTNNCQENDTNRDDTTQSVVEHQRQTVSKKKLVSGTTIIYLVQPLYIWYNHCISGTTITYLVQSFQINQLIVNKCMGLARMASLAEKQVVLVNRTSALLYTHRSFKFNLFSTLHAHMTYYINYHFPQFR